MTRNYLGCLQKHCLSSTGKEKSMLTLSNPDKTTFCLQVYSDAVSATNYELSSQLGCLIFLMDKVCTYQLEILTAYRGRKANRSVVGIELIASPDGFDM